MALKIFISDKAVHLISHVRTGYYRERRYGARCRMLEFVGTLESYWKPDAHCEEIFQKFFIEWRKIQHEVSNRFESFSYKSHINHRGNEPVLTPSEISASISAAGQTEFNIRDYSDARRLLGCSQHRKVGWGPYNRRVRVRHMDTGAVDGTGTVSSS